MRLSRRQWLSAAAGAAFGLPFLRTFARADGAAPLRLVIVWSPNDGQWVSQYETPLTNGVLPASLPSFLQPLEAFRDRLAVLGNIDNVFQGGHTSIGHALTGVDWVGPSNNDFWAGGISVDQHIAQALDVQALTLGVTCGVKNGKGRMSYAAAGTPIDPIEDPSAAFAALFADVGVDAAELAARRARKRSVLDRVAADLQRFQKEVPAAQRPRLEQHLDSVRALEKQLDSGLLASCDPTVPDVTAFGDNAHVPETTRAQMRIMAQALGCGATRVATLQLGRAGGSFTPLWPTEGLDIGLHEHELAHAHYLEPDNATVLAQTKSLEAWYSTQLAFLLAELDAIPDIDGGTLLDNTLVLHVKELSRNHATDAMTYVAAGGPSAMVGNRFTDFAGRPHNDLLLALCHKMGVESESFGDTSVTTGPLLF